MNKMKVVFYCGYQSNYGLAHLKPVLHSNFSLGGVVISTNRRWENFIKSISGDIYKINPFYRQVLIIILEYSRLRNLLSNINIVYQKLSVIRLSMKYKVPFWFVDNINSEESIKKIKSIKPDLIISAAFPQIFSNNLLAIPKKGSVNFHPSLLPKYRGAHPHFWVIVRGERVSGLTAHFMTDRVDHGDIIAQIKYKISNYNYDELNTKMITEVPEIVQMVEDYFLKGKGKLKKQNNKNASFFRNDREIHHRIFWSIHTARNIYNLARGKNCFCFFRNKKLFVEKCFMVKKNRNLTNSIKVENGTIVDIRAEGIVVKAKINLLLISSFRDSKNKKLSFQQFLYRHNPLIGEKLY